MRPLFRNRRPGSYWLVALVILFLVAGLVYWLDSKFGGTLDEGNNAPRLVHHVLLLALVGAAVVGGFRMRAGTTIRYIAWWAGIFAFVILAYSFRYDVSDLGDRIVGELRPDLVMTTPDGEVAVRRGGDGHFRLTATVDGRPIRFLVDTGATVVVLSAADATRIGLDPATLSYSFQARTASGVARTARISLGEISAGPILVRNVPAAVIRDGLSESLLGQSFLNRLSGYEVHRDLMILRP